jgi:hypothetical protein
MCFDVNLPIGPHLCWLGVDVALGADVAYIHIKRIVIDELKWVIIFLYTYISMTHYKSLISILSICKYVISSHAMLSFSIKKYFQKFKEHATSPYVTSSFSIKNNSKNSKKSPQVTSPFSIEKIILKIQIPCHIASCHVTFSIEK